MAEAVAVALWEIGGAFLTDAAIFLASNAVAVNTVAFAAANLTYGTYQRRKAQGAARAAANAALQDRTVMSTGTAVARSRCYGKVRNVDGVLFKGSHGEHRKFYTMVVALAGHEIDGVERVMFGDSELTLDGSGYVQTAPWAGTDLGSGAGSITLDGSGNGSLVASGTIVVGSQTATYRPIGDPGDDVVATTVTGGNTINITGGVPGAVVNISYQTSTASSKARVRAFLGGPGQDLSSELHALGILADDGTTNLINVGADRFEGIACLLITLEYSQDAFPSGLPQVSAVFRGAKVLDPRTDVVAWSENPALHALDWSQYAYGGAMPSSGIDEASFIAAANACDTSTAFSVGGGYLVQPLFRGGIVISTDANPQEGLDEIVEAMAGKWVRAGGVLRVQAGVYRAPGVTITESWLSGAEDIGLVPAPARDELVNVYRPSIADYLQGFVVAPAPEVRSATYITADVQELPREITMGAVTDTVRAQHICGVLMRDARQGLTLTLPCNLRAWQLEVFDVVRVTLPRFGFVDKLFEVLGWKFSMTGGVVLTLKETAASIYDPSAGLEIDYSADNTALPLPWVVPQVTGLAVASGTPLLVDGLPTTRTEITWAAVDSQAVLQSGAIEVEGIEAALLTTGSVWQHWECDGSATSLTLPGLRYDRVYLFRARARNTIGVRGAWSVQAQHKVSEPPSSKAINLRASSTAFKISKTGAVSPSSITLTADGVGLAGIPSFSVTVGTATLAGTGGFTRTLAEVDMVTDLITVTVDWDGATDTISIVKMRDGTDGAGSGSATFSWILYDAAVADAPNSIRNSTSSGFAAASGSSVESYIGGAQCSFKVAVLADFMGCGLGEAAGSGGPNYRWTFFEAGTASAAGPTGGTYSTAFSLSDTFAVLYDGADVKWYHNGAVVKTVAVSGGMTFYLKSQLNKAGSKFEAVAFSGTVTGSIIRNYRQESDPGGVPDGSTWTVPSTGQSFIRQGGAWIPYVGPGSVTTDEIQVQAVTAAGVTLNASTSSSGSGTGDTVSVGFFVGPSITLDSGDTLDLSIDGLHNQEILGQIGTTRYVDMFATEIWLQIQRGVETAVEVGKRVKIVSPARGPNQTTPIPIPIKAQVVPGAGTWAITCFYRVTGLNDQGYAPSRNNGYEASAEWRFKRIKR